MEKQLKFIFRLFLLTCICSSSCVAGSLWNKSGNRGKGMYSDRVATRYGDLVTILVSESSSMMNSVSTSTAKSSSWGSDFSQFLFSDLLRKDGEHPSMDLSTDRSHDGGASINNSNQLTARITVMVRDVLPNGNLVLEGTRKISFSGETVYMLTRGICRQEDLESDNSISSSFIADANIEFISEGDLTDAQKKGWLVRFADRFGP